MGGLLAYLAAQAIAAIKRKTLVYGLMSAGGLITIFAAGYALNAAYTMLMFRYGATASSLIVTGALLTVAIGCIVAARIIARRPHVPAAARTAPNRAPFPRPYSRQRLIALAAGLAGAASTGVALVKFPSLRTLLRGRKPR
ncbi:tryptophan-rich sensory protein [Bosea sp. PAMC 26642]|uniref:tryptophan-rich sensory protein n=1 Tax=Bosea sp. (strain PAMC 26642) TaxID=1792307 RepID=UPI0007703557|nr:tryptophan-rich sensory protein [Bosea sp. PAMC 26642]AMJ61948.1 hypothetical protein AXW83_18055 [Bosea sp. PAMC 26642]